MHCRTSTSNLSTSYSLRGRTYWDNSSWVIVATSLLTEIVHLRSDLYTKNSLPIPIVSVIDPKKASLLANYGFDTIGKVVTIFSLADTLSLSR